MAAAAKDGSSTTPTSLRILVVEDHEDSRELMAELLRQTGAHRITLAETGEEGLRYLRSETYDLIVTDIGLPEMSGLEMLDQAEQEGLLAGREVVVCSANHWLQHQVVARGGRYIPKPVDIAQISDAVRATPAPLPPEPTNPSAEENEG